MTLAKPGSSKPTLYSPGGIAAKRYCPWSLVTSVRVPIIAGLVIVTVTPGSTAFVLSVTMPFMAPVVALVVCAAAADENTRTQIQPNHAGWRVIVPSWNGCARTSPRLLLPRRRCLLGQVVAVDRVLDVR